MIKKDIQQLITDQIKQHLNTEIAFVPVNYPEHRKFGDYATPVCMGLAKTLRKNPKQIAQTLAESLNEHEMFKKVETAGPGFINFFLSDQYLESLLDEILNTNSDPGENQSLSGETTVLEYVSANPTGPLHIGHGRWAAIGSSIASIAKLCGAEIYQEFYINDAGNQIKLLNDSVDAARNQLPIPENGYHGEYISKLIESDELPEKILLNQQKQTLENLHVHFDCFFSEKTLHQNGLVNEVLELLKKNHYSYEKEDAVWFKSTDFGDDKDRVLVKADGNYTYFAVDIAYHFSKMKRYGKDRQNKLKLINILGADHHGYVSRLTAAVKVLSEMMQINAELIIIIGQLVSLYRDSKPVRMSKRTGEMITLQEVADEIGTDAARYLLVTRKTDTPLDFDIETAKKKSDENPVYYVQYASARSYGILQNSPFQQKEIDQSGISDVLNNEEARYLLIEMLKYPEILSESAKTWEPHRIPVYLENLASHFHRFYNKHRVIDEENKTLSLKRLQLVRAFRKIISSGLQVIGVNAPERM